MRWRADMAEQETSVDETSKHGSKTKRLRYWIVGSVLLTVAVVVAFVVMQRRARSEARERARIDALGTLEEAKREAERAKKELGEALERVDEERQRFDSKGDAVTPSEPRYIDTNGLTQDKYTEDKALRAGEPPPPPVDRKPPPDRD